MRMYIKFKERLRNVDDFTIAFIFGLVFYAFGGASVSGSDLHTSRITANAILATMFIVSNYAIIRIARIFFEKENKNPS